MDKPTVRKNSKKLVLAGTGFFVLMALFAITLEYFSKKSSDINFHLENEKVIMHAMGGIDGIDYTNSLEAFEKHYARGRRIFEVDLALTSDNKIVAKHLARVDASKDEFLQTKIDGKYTPLSLEDVLSILIDHEEMILVTDAKKEHIKVVSEIVEFLKEKDEDSLDRVIPQVYSKQNYKDVMAVYTFNKAIYTLYQEKPTDEEVVDFIKWEKNIHAVTMSKARFSEKSAQKIHELGIQVFVHTLNKDREIRKYIEKGADGIYTDSY